MSPVACQHSNSRRPMESHKIRSDRHPTLHTQQTYWGYEDIGLFFFSSVFLGVLLRSAVRLRLLNPSSLNQPTLMLQVVVLLYLMACLYTILKLRYRRHVWRALGWTRPSLGFGVIGLFGGAALGVPVTLFVRWAGWLMPPIRLLDLAVLGALLGPVLEESFFRGCLLPVLARTAGVPVAIGLSAVLFTALHKPPTLAQWLCFTATGAAYGWIRVKSRSTTAAMLMHSAYNVTLFLCQVARLC